MIDIVFITTNLLLGIGLAMDAFSVSLADGLTEPRMKKGKMAFIALLFAVFQGVMPMIGWVCVHSFVEKFKKDEEKSVEDIAREENAEDFQAIQSKIAIAGGGLLGKAPGRSTQRNYLPHPYSDFIFAIIVEEYGLLGGAFVVLLYLILLYRAIRIMVTIPQSFGGFVAFGLAFMMVMQAMVNIGVAVGMFPVTGQPLPFVSMGGTSILFTGCSLGIILSVSKELDKTKERQDELATTEDNN